MFLFIANCRPQVAAWGITEVIRYSYYALNTLNGKAPYVLLWLRYTLFYILYPLGVGSEIGLIITSLPWIRETDIFSVHMPNQWNFAFSYPSMLILAILSYLPGTPPFLIEDRCEITVTNGLAFFPSRIPYALHAHDHAEEKVPRGSCCSQAAVR